MAVDIPEEAKDDIRRKTVAVDGNASLAVALVAVAIEGAQIAAPHIRAPLLGRIVELEAKLAESERLAGVLREQRNAAEDELRGRA
jgi:hypothetical protein